MWKLTEHTADLGIEIEAHDLKGLFEEATSGLYEAVGRLKPTGEPRSQTVRFSSFELDTLIRDFLAEVLYFLQVEELVVEVLKLEQISDDEIEFQLSLYAIDLEQSQFIREVKAVTYHQLSVERMAVGYRAHVLLDL